MKTSDHLRTEQVNKVSKKIINSIVKRSLIEDNVNNDITSNFFINEKCLQNNCFYFCNFPCAIFYMTL